MNRTATALHAWRQEAVRESSSPVNRSGVRRWILSGIVASTCAVVPLAADGASPAGEPAAPPTTADAYISLDLQDLKSLDARSLSTPMGPEVSSALVGSQQSAAMTPGYDPISGLVGTIIGIQLGNSLRKSSDQRQANEPIASLRHEYDEQRATLRLEEQLLAALREYEPGFGTCMGDARDRSGCKSEMRLRPRITVDCNYRCIDVSLAARWITDRRKEFYQNRLEFQSDPLPAGPTPGNADAWAGNDMAALRAALSQATRTLAGMLAADLTDGRTNLAARNTETLRYRNAVGVFHERGEVVREEPGRWLIRTIGGGLKSIPVERRLTTAEYYELLTGPPSSASATDGIKSPAAPDPGPTPAPAEAAGPAPAP